MSANLGLVRVASAVPELKVANTEFNGNEIIKLIKQAEKKHTGCILFPELCITGYTCADLFYQEHLYDSQLEMLDKIVETTRGLKITVILGFYMRIRNNLCNCAAIIQNGRLKGVVPKMFMPNADEFYEARWFASGLDIAKDIDRIMVNGDEVPFGNLIFADEENKLALGLEICEDLWLPISPGSQLALGGAHIIFNPSASNETAGKADYRRNLVSVESARNICGYVYASAGASESTTDVVFSGHSMIAENGRLVGESKLFPRKSEVLYSEIDFERIKFSRMHNYNFTQCVRAYSANGYYKTVPLEPIRLITEEDTLIRHFRKMPFLPVEQDARDKQCRDIFDIQATALAKRIEHSHANKVVVGISGGLDSTLALLSACHAMKLLNRSTKDVIAVTMPGFGTTGKTYENALTLMKLLGADVREISIKDAVTQHFEDIGQDPSKRDATYENAQARERTQILMDISNMEGGFVLGTGDMSEMALGWCTYNGDHMSMYGINAGLPKTLIQIVIKWVKENRLQGPDADPHFSLNNEELAEILQAILDTPISPELLPPDEHGDIAQKTEDNVGPYELHDFFIYHTLKYGMAPNRLVFAAKNAFADQYDEDFIKKWLAVFYRRFFSQQFKRNCVPDGPKVSSIGLSPRGDWKMPSDADVQTWLEQL